MSKFPRSCLSLWFVVLAICVQAQSIPQQGMVLWLDASRGVALKNNIVEQWNDQSKMQNHAKRFVFGDSSISSPVIIKNAVNGKSVLRFDGTDASFALKRIADMRTIFWVVSKDSTAFGQRNERFVFGDAEFNLHYNTDFHVGTHTKSFILHTNTSAAFLREGQVRVNGLLVDGTTTDFPKTLGIVSLISTGTVAASRISNDRNYKGRCWQGDIAEIIAYNRVLNNEERAMVEQYLFKKYSIVPGNQLTPYSGAWRAAEASHPIPLNPGAEARPAALMCLKFSNDGKTILTGSDAVRLWNISNGKLIRELGGKPGPEMHGNFASGSGQVTQLCLSRNGEYIAAAGTDLVLRLWRGSDGSIVPLSAAMAKPGMAMWGMAFSPTGEMLLINAREKPNDVRSFKITTGEQTTLLEKPHNDWQGRLWSLAYSHQGKLIASGNENKSIRIWDAASGKLVHVFNTGSVPWDFAFSPDDKTLAVACVNMTLQLWDMPGRKLKKTLAGHAAALTSIAYSPDGKTIATGSNDGTIKFWNALTGKVIKTLIAHSNGVWTVEFSPDGRILASGGQDNKLKIWNAVTGDLLHSIDAGAAK